MSRLLCRSFAFALVGAFLTAAGTPTAGWGAEPGKATIVLGADLFRHVWVVADPRSVAGDGLGPLFNAESCAACHRQGGTGGAGPNENNVDLVTRVTPTPHPENFIPLPVNIPGGFLGVAPKRDKSEAKSSDRIAKLHPELGTGSGAAGTTIVHRHGVESDYDLRRFELLGFKAPRHPSESERRRLESAFAERQRRQAPVTDYKVVGTSLRRSQRQTPALFGVGRIDRVTDDELRRVAAEQLKLTNGVSGRIALGQPERPHPYGDPHDPTNAPRTVVGKFGWRGQTGSLRQFVLNACANELGLEVPDRHQALDPLHPDAAPAGLDLDRDACEALVAFVASLPAPRQVLPPDNHQRQQVLGGEHLFTKIGCSDCHRAKLGEVEGIYSDLLLHELGAELADPVAAAPPTVFNGFAGAGGLPANVGQLIAFYSGFASNSPTLQQEWRTPPLWGVHDSAPYLHDGRAKTLDEAIRLHGGEATHATKEYKSLNAGERHKLLAFLDSLAVGAGDIAE